MVIKTTCEVFFYSGDHNTHAQTPPQPPCHLCKRKKRLRAIGYVLTAESVKLPSPPRQQWEKDSSSVQAILPLICLQSHEPSRNTRWMKGEHLYACAEGIVGEGADAGKVSKWIPLRHLREQWEAFSTFFVILCQFSTNLLIVNS